METEELNRLYEALFTALYDTTLCLPGTRKLSNSRIDAFLSPIRHEIFNIITRYDLRSHEIENYSSLIQEVVDFYAKENSPVRWPVDSNSVVLLERPLQAAGFQQTSSVSKIALRVPKGEIANLGLEDELKCVRISDSHLMVTWIQVFVTAYKLNGEFAEGFSRWVSLFNQSEQRDQFTHFLFLKEEEPIGTGSLFFNGKSVGVYNVAILPEFRKMGFGIKLMGYLQREILLSPAEWVLGTATPDGMSVYRKWNPIFISEVCYFDRQPGI